MLNNQNMLKSGFTSGMEIWPLTDAKMWPDTISGAIILFSMCQVCPSSPCYISTCFGTKRQTFPSCTYTVDKRVAKAACGFAAGINSNKSTHTHTHARLTAICPGLPGWASTRKVKPIWILLKQETVASAGQYASLHLAASTPLLSK